MSDSVEIKIGDRQGGRNIQPPEDINRSFGELIKSKQNKKLIDLRDIYKEIFYLLPKKGKKSHHTIINQSREYLLNYNDPKDKEIEELLERIENLEDELLKLESPKDSGNPFFPDGSFLRLSAISENSLPSWLMHNGWKRRFTNKETLITAKRAQGIDSDIPDIQILQEVEEDLINDIPSGDALESDLDLVKIDDDKTSEITDLTVNDFITLNTVDYVCKEKEYFDNNGKCKITYRNRIAEIKTSDLFENDEDSFENMALPSSNLGFGLVEVKGWVVGKRISDGKEINFNEPTQGEINMEPKYSSFGTRMFRKPRPNGDGYAWDSKGDPGVWTEVLNKPDNVYYNTNFVGNYNYTSFGSATACAGSQIYGAPILRYNNAYIVECKSVGRYHNELSGYSRRVYFLYLNGSNATKDHGSMSNTPGVHHMKHSQWEDKNLCSPSYTSNSKRLKYDPAGKGDVGDSFNKKGYTWNRNGSRHNKLC